MQAWATINVALVLSFMLLHACSGDDSVTLALLVMLSYARLGYDCVALALLVMLLHACSGDDQCRSRIASHAVAWHAWATINVARIVSHAVACMLGRRSMSPLHCQSCCCMHAWATIVVVLALLVMLLHARLGDDQCHPCIVSHAVACMLG